MSWSAVKLGDVCIDGGIQTGPFGSQLHQSDYSDEGTPVVMPVDLADGGISTERIARVSDDHVQRLSRHMLEPGDVVYARRGDVGRCSRVTESEKGWLCGTGCLRLRADSNLVDKTFLYYALSNPSVVGWVRNHAIGATMPNLNTTILGDVPLYIPDNLEDQRRIASILMAYDNLIENNRSQIALLEEAAQRLYKEWFVDLRFPGHEEAGFNDELPHGWTAASISEYVQVVKGCSYSSAEIDVSNGVPMVNLASVAPWGGYKSFSERVYGGAYRADQLLDQNDVVMAMTEQTAGLAGYVARVPRYAAGAVPSMDLVCLRPMKGSKAYLYGAFRYGNVSRLLSPLANGTKIRHLKPEVFDYTKMLIPPAELQERFESVVSPAFSTIDNFYEQIALLQRGRDQLLPKLMSGEVEVSQ